MTSDINTKDLIECGISGWKPKWLQKLASKKSYIFIYSMLGMYESAISSYLGGCITTIEKRFKLPSSVLGLIGSGWDTGSMLTSMFFAYMGSSGHKTRWIAGGALAMGLACYLRFIPHLLYGPGDEAIFQSSNISSIDNLCYNTNNITENCLLNNEGRTTSIILYIAQILTGIGTSAYFTLGATYLDDNVSKNKFPFLQGLVMFVRLFGPTIGLMISSYALSIFINFGKQPSFNNNDPRWVGAWYLAWIPFGCIGLVISFCISLFPKVLPREALRRKTKREEVIKKRNRSFTDFKETIIRLSKNRILMLNSFSTVFFAIGGMGFWTFLPKYFEYQFRKSASEANFIAGSIGLICTAFGIITSGIVLSLCRPRPKYIAGWNVLTEILQTASFIILGFLGCFREDMAGHYDENGYWITTTGCNKDCGCIESMPYSPICSVDKSTTYYSPCHAGCTTTTIINGTKLYGNCSCIEDGFGNATDGACPLSCNTDFVLFILLICVSEFLTSTGKAGNTIIQFRSVDPQDKAVSIAMMEFLICAAAYIPGPILFGYLMDYTCLIWGVICGERGNCWVYDSRKMSNTLNFTAGGFQIIATLLDIGVWLLVGDLQLYEPPNEQHEAEEKNILNCLHRGCYLD